MINKNKTDKAISLRVTLVLITFFSIIITGVGFYFAQNYLKEQAIKASDHVDSSEISSLSSDDSKIISSKKPILDKLDIFFSDPTNYKDKIIEDLTFYAAASNLSIISSEEINSGGVTSIRPDSGSPIATKNISINLKNPVNIKDFIKFLKLTESSLPKMQLTGLTMKKSNNLDSIEVDSLTFEVYLK